jgi:O-antigen ligase
VTGLVFTYLFTAAGALGSLRWPLLGLQVYIGFAILKPELLWFWVVPTGNYSRLVAIGLLAGWAINGFGDWKLGKAWPTVLMIVGYLGWGMVSTVALAPNKDLAWDWLDNVAKIVIPVVVGVTLINSVDQLIRLAWVIVGCECYLALEFNQWYFSGYNLLWAQGSGGMDNNCNAIALVTCIGLAALLGLELESRWKSLLVLGGIGLMAHAVLFSFSRGGMTAMIVTGIATFVLVKKRPGNLLLLLAAACAIISLAGPQVVERFQSSFVTREKLDWSAESRLVLWRICWDMMTSNPFGVGANCFGEFMPLYGFPRGKLAHSLWLQIGAELGFIGLSFLVLFYLTCMARLLPYCRDSVPVSDPRLRTLARAVIAGLIGFAVSAQFVSLDRLEHPYYIAMIGAGVLKLGSRPAEEACADAEACADPGESPGVQAGAVAEDPMFRQQDEL